MRAEVSEMETGRESNLGKAGDNFVSYSLIPSREINSHTGLRPHRQEVTLSGITPRIRPGTITFYCVASHMKQHIRQLRRLGVAATLLFRACQLVKHVAGKGTYGHQRRQCPVEGRAMMNNEVATHTKTTIRLIAWSQQGPQGADDLGPVEPDRNIDVMAGRLLPRPQDPNSPGKDIWEGPMRAVLCCCHSSLSSRGSIRPMQTPDNWGISHLAACTRVWFLWW